MEIVLRAAWKAEPPRGAVIPMRVPAKELWLHHSVTGVTEDPSADMRFLQRIAFSRKFSDISYSWAVHTSGMVLEGRGTNVGAHTAGRNSTSFGVVLIGDYTRRVVTDAQVDSVRQLVAALIAQGALNPGLYPTGGHRQAPGANTVCPGEFAMRRLPEMRAPWIGIPDPPKEVAPMFDPPIQIAAWCLVDYAGGGLVAVAPDGAVFCEPADLYRGGPNGKAYWGARRAAKIEQVGESYRITATTAETYGPEF